MLETIRNLMFGSDRKTGSDERFTADEKQVAEAALMFHVVAVDGIVTEEEREQLSDVLSRHFNLSGDEVSSLIEEARQADQEAIDLFGFTRVLKHELTKEERLALIGNLWEMVYADGVVNEFEDNVVWRVAELLDIDTRDRMELKREIAPKTSDD